MRTSITKLVPFGAIDHPFCMAEEHGRGERFAVAGAVAVSPVPPRSTATAVAPTRRCAWHTHRAWAVRLLREERGPRCLCLHRAEGQRYYEEPQGSKRSRHGVLGL